MIFIDSSVWIDYLSPRGTRAGQVLDELIRPNNQTLITGIIFQEVIQRIRNLEAYQTTQKLMRKLPFLIPDSETHLKAADIFQNLSNHGKICSTIDALIAALAIQHRVRLFTLDTDFRAIQAHSSLQLFE